MLVGNEISYYLIEKRGNLPNAKTVTYLDSMQAK